ncbi:DUF3866 family protein [Proteiniborus sp. MB09-C3]|nr:DUF3866 family protein [Proteiniborus sp. MB09-C3]WIV13952.1 DUF3866 family protein [Proteiniborus sp. MB09-C3]
MNESDDQVAWVNVEVEGESAKAVNYNAITGYVNEGDKVVLNTTAIELGLGTGGYHFIIFNYKNKEHSITKGLGHIMKLRYTPLQFKCFAAEEQDSKYHEEFKSFKSLKGSIYIVGTLHSMLAPIAAVIKNLRPELNITYIMTDAGALPLHFSKTVKLLKDKEIIKNTITVGHAFGGDIECVNIYTGIIAAKVVANSDITIITMGPGIVGTDTKYGFSGIEQGYIIDAINNLGGISLAVPRISFADKRERHQGISHHTLTILNEVANTKTNLVLPVIKGDYAEFIDLQIKENNINNKHNIIFENGSDIIKALNYYGLEVKTMGRGYYDDEVFFLALGAAAKASIRLLENVQ